MNIKNHWSFLYFINKIKVILYFKLNPTMPWFSKKCNLFLSKHLKIDMNGLEFGSGRSSLWLSARVGHLVSLEHNIEWFNFVNKKAENINNLNLVFANDEGYWKYLESVPDGSLSFCIVDGLYRDIVAQKAFSKLKPGGFMLIDDAQRYIPSVNSFSPGRNIGINENWLSFKEKIEANIKLYFSDGVTDQLIIFK